MGTVSLLLGNTPSLIIFLTHHNTEWFIFSQNRIQFPLYAIHDIPQCTTVIQCCLKINFLWFFFSPLPASNEVVIDRTVSHRQIKVTSSGRGFFISPEDSSAPSRPLQFDQTCCALGSPAINSGQCYWEVDVHCCSSWAVGVAYGSLHRKGQDKSTKLGRNRLSWSLEFWDRRLSAWHNDRYLTLSTRAVPDKVGVFVNYHKGRIVFYNADAMTVLQDFSTSCTNVFERARHQFTEPVFPAFRFFKARDQQRVPDHMEICDLGL